MSVERQVKNQIIETWKDKQVANWVIDSLPLLEIGLTQQECPVYTLSLEEGLKQKNTAKPIQRFKETLKLVMSGGFEGTVGHLKAVDNLHEIRALTTNGDCLLVLMLEPDSYICNVKDRDSLINLHQREVLWSTSGLIDAVILIPDSSLIENKGEYFSRMSERIGQTRWCTSIENPAWREIITRDDMSGALDIVRANNDELYVHTSLLAYSKNVDSDEMKQRIYDDILSRIEKMESPDLLKLIPLEVLAENIFDRVSRGL